MPAHLARGPRRAVPWRRTLLLGAALLMLGASVTEGPLSADAQVAAPPPPPVLSLELVTEGAAGGPFTVTLAQDLLPP